MESIKKKAFKLALLQLKTTSDKAQNLKSAERMVR